MKGRFVLIAGIGHCGTKWLAQVLSQRNQGIIFHHQYKYTMTLKTWAGWLEMEYERPLAFDEYLERYAQHMQSLQARYRVVGDAISWMPHSLPTINKAIRINRVIYMVRNGIPQLNSIWHSSQFGRQPPDAWMYTTYLQTYWRLMARPYKPHWSKWTKWEKACLWWATNAFMPGWLKRQLPGAKLAVYRLEDLTQKTGTLDKLVGSMGLKMGGETLRRAQGKDVNRKIGGSRDPAVVWTQWPKEWREAFAVICGPGMKRLGYKIPS